MKTLYLHIGTPKTATTSIQAFCVVNRELLAEKGYCYPDLGFRYQGKNKNRNGAFLGGVFIDKEKRERPDIEAENFKQGMAQVKALFAEYDNVILSDEGIWWDAHTKRRRTLWKELRAYIEEGGYQVKVIVYLRRQDQLVESQWNQRIKHAVAADNTMTWEEFLPRWKKYVAADYAKELDRIEKELGREAIIVRRFRRDCFIGGDILDDFLHQVGLELTDEYELPEEELNQRFSGNIVEIKRILNGMSGMDDQGRVTMEDLLTLCSDDSERDYPSQMFSPEEADAFAAQFEASNQKVVDRYLGDGQPLFGDSRQKAKWSRDNPYMRNDIIRFSGQATLFLLKRIEEQEKELQAVKRTVQTLQEAECAQERRYRKLLEMLKHPIQTLFRKLFRRKKR